MHSNTDKSADKFAEMHKAGIDAMTSLAYMQFATLERFAALNLNTAKVAFEGAAEHVKALLEARDPQEMAKLNGGYAQPSIAIAIAYSKNVSELAQQTTVQVSKLVETNAVELNKAVAGVLDSVAKNTPVGSDVTATAMKSALTLANTTYNNIAAVAKQTAQAVEANVAAAAHAANGSRTAKQHRAA